MGPVDLSTVSSEWVKLLSPVGLFATPWTVTQQILPSMGSSGKNTGVGCHFLFQGIFPTQGSNPRLLHGRQILFHLSHQGSHLGLKKIKYLDFYVTHIFSHFFKFHLQKMYSLVKSTFPSYLIHKHVWNSMLWLALILWLPCIFLELPSLLCFCFCLFSCPFTNFP